MSNALNVSINNGFLSNNPEERQMIMCAVQILSIITVSNGCKISVYSPYQGYKTVDSGSPKEVVEACQLSVDPLQLIITKDGEEIFEALVIYSLEPDQRVFCNTRAEDIRHKELFDTIVAQYKELF